MSPARVTVNVNGVLPLVPSNCVAFVAVIAKVSVLLFSIKPVAVDVPSVTGVLGLLNVTVNPSLGATTVLPLTLIVTICVD